MVDYFETKHGRFTGESEKSFVYTKFPVLLMLDDLGGNFQKRYFVNLCHGTQSTLNYPALLSYTQSIFLPQGLWTCYFLCLVDHSLDGHGPLLHLSPYSTVTSSEQSSLISPFKNSTMSLSPQPPFFFFMVLNHSLTLHACLTHHNARSMKVGISSVLFTAASPDSST